MTSTNRMESAQYKASLRENPVRHMPSTTPTTEPMPAERSGLLAEFARACKAAARAVSLYPGAHPAIGGSLVPRGLGCRTRSPATDVSSAACIPDMLVIDGQAPVRPDPAIGELAALLHDRLIGELTIQRDADAEDWHALLLLLARAPEDLMADGGIGQAWAASGRSHFEIREIDYAEVLRERAGGDEGRSGIASSRMCLQGDQPMARRARARVAASSRSSDPDTVRRAARALPGIASRRRAVSVGARPAALAPAGAHGARGREAPRTRRPPRRALQTIADSCARLTPEMMLAMLGSRQSRTPPTRRWPTR